MPWSLNSTSAASRARHASAASAGSGLRRGHRASATPDAAIERRRPRLPSAATDVSTSRRPAAATPAGDRSARSGSVVEAAAQADAELLDGGRVGAERRHRARCHREGVPVGLPPDRLGRASTPRVLGGGRRVPAPPALRHNSSATASNPTPERASVVRSKTGDGDPPVDDVGDAGGDDGADLAIGDTSTTRSERIEFVAVEQRGATVERDASMQQPAAHVGVERGLLHAQPGCGLGCVQLCQPDSRRYMIDQR